MAKKPKTAKHKTAANGQGEKMKRKAYEKELRKLQVDLCYLQDWVKATGASQLARRDVGTPVFGGMILASFIGIFAIPPLYVFFQAIRERLRPSSRPVERSASERSGV